MIIDLRSDTVTKPSPKMLEAMTNAEVGDDVFSEDLSVNALEAFAAEMFDMESAIFCPSGTMTNQIAINVHTQPGNEVICDHQSHVYIYEGGGIAFNSGCQVKPILGTMGIISAKQIEAAINPNDIHKAPTALVCLENSANRGGGATYNFEDFFAIKSICVENKLALHLDGARLFNAIAANNESCKEYGKIFDSISICLSKGLGAPVGSLLLGSNQTINKARRIRKLFGGGMRQAGFMAAAGLYALKNNVERLVVDHANAKRIAKALSKKDFIGNILPVETNIIIFEVSGKYNPQSLCDKLKKNNILCFSISKTQVRMVFHLDISPSMVEELEKLIAAL